MAFLRGFLNFRPGRNDPDPTKVLEVKPDEYVLCNVVAREESLVLYQYISTATDGSNNSTQQAAPNCGFDIVMHKDVTRSPHMAFSVLRCGSLDDAELRFIQLKCVLPLFLECIPDQLTRDMVQEVSNVVRANPTWSVAHIAAHLGLVDCFKTPKLQPEDTFMTPLHVAIKAQKLTSVQALMNLDARLDLADHNGDTVFHAAAVTNKDIIKSISSRPRPDELINQANIDGYTPLQLACLTDKPDCVRELLKEGADVNSASSNLIRDGASTADSKRLGRDNVDQNVNNFQIEDMKHGGTPLHWAKTTACLETMVELGCDINAKNFQSNTALHIMVARGRLSCVICLLSHNADVNAKGSDGDTPLHIAVRSDVSILQALIIFGADVNAVNDKGETPRHLASISKQSKKDLVLYTLHAVGAKRCSASGPQSSTSGSQSPVTTDAAVSISCADGCALNGSFDGTMPDKPDFYNAPHLYNDLLGASIVKEAIRKARERRASSSGTAAGTKSRRCRGLSLDGGGIRGLVIIQCLIHLERILGMPVYECFDWVAGTSTGGILAIMLARRMSPMRCFQLYFSLKDKVFSGGRPHDSDALERFLKQEFGEDTYMTDVKHPKLVITGVLADRHPAQLHLFRNYDAPNIVLGAKEEKSDFPPCLPPEKQPLWSAGRASGAAPTYFRPFGRFLDGGLIANNPTLDLITEKIELNAAYKAVGQPEMCEDFEVIVSVGTGKIPVIPVTIIDMLHLGSGLLGAAKMAFGAKALGQLIVDQATQSNGRLVDRAQAWCHSLNMPYFRINAPLSDDVCLNETDNRILVKILWETMVYMRIRRDELEELAELLKP